MKNGMRTLFPIVTEKTEPLDLLRKIVRARIEEDVPGWQNLPNLFVSGRSTFRIPSASSDVQTTDRIGDVVNDSTYQYQLLKYSTGVTKWDFRPLNNAPTVVTLLNTQTATSSASIAFDSNLLTNGYKNFQIEIDNLVVTTSTADLYMLASINNSSSYLGSSSYNYHIAALSSTSASYGANSSTSASQILLGQSLGNSTGQNYSGTLTIRNPSDTTVYKTVNVKASQFNSAGNLIAYEGSGGILTVSAVNNIKINASSGNITSGTFKLYGIT